MRERRREHLYDAVACGMWLYVHSAFEVVLLGGEHLRMRPGLLVLATHRSDTDVPLICAELYFGDRMWKRHHLRLHFAARDDLFERGVIAGLLPPTVPLPARRTLYGFDPTAYLAAVRVHPIRHATTAKAVQALRSDLSRPIGETLPVDLVDRIVARAAANGVPAPNVAAGADRAEFADLVWTDVSLADMPQTSFFWQRRGQEAVRDLRRLLALVRDREPLLLFPEGRPSPDGAIGPLRKGVGLFVRRGAPDDLLPIAIAYDPFTRGRPRACLAVGAPFPPAEANAEEQILAALRRLTPLTCAQVVADRIVGEAEAGRTEVRPALLDAELAQAVEASRLAGRPVDPVLESDRSRRARLTACLESLARRGVVQARDPRTVVLDVGRLLEDGELRRAAVEYASARTAP